MDQRHARRVVKAAASAFCREQAERQPDLNDPADRLRMITAWRGVADELDPGEIDTPLPTNLTPLVRPDGSTFDGWQRSDGDDGYEQDGGGDGAAAAATG